MPLSSGDHLTLGPAGCEVKHSAGLEGISPLQKRATGLQPRRYHPNDPTFSTKKSNSHSPLKQTALYQTTTRPALSRTALPLNRGPNRFLKPLSAPPSLPRATQGTKPRAGFLELNGSTAQLQSTETHNSQQPRKTGIPIAILQFDSLGTTPDAFLIYEDHQTTLPDPDITINLSPTQSRLGSIQSNSSQGSAHQAPPWKTASEVSFNFNPSIPEETEADSTSLSDADLSSSLNTVDHHTYPQKYPASVCASSLNHRSLTGSEKALVPGVYTAGIIVDERPLSSTFAFSDIEAWSPLMSQDPAASKKPRPTHCPSKASPTETTHPTALRSKRTNPQTISHTNQSHMSDRDSGTQRETAHDSTDGDPHRSLESESERRSAVGNSTEEGAEDSTGVRTRDGTGDETGGYSSGGVSGDGTTNGSDNPNSTSLSHSNTESTRSNRTSSDSFSAAQNPSFTSGRPSHTQSRSDNNGDILPNFNETRTERGGLTASEQGNQDLRSSPPDFRPLILPKTPSQQHLPFLTHREYTSAIEGPGVTPYRCSAMPSIMTAELSNDVYETENPSPPAAGESPMPFHTLSPISILPVSAGSNVVRLVQPQSHPTILRGVPDSHLNEGPRDTYGSVPVLRRFGSQRSLGHSPRAIRPHTTPPSSPSSSGNSSTVGVEGTQNLRGYHQPPTDPGYGDDSYTFIPRPFSIRRSRPGTPTLLLQSNQSPNGYFTDPRDPHGEQLMVSRSHTPSGENLSLSSPSLQMPPRSPAESPVYYLSHHHHATRESLVTVATSEVIGRNMSMYLGLKTSYSAQELYPSPLSPPPTQPPIPVVLDDSLAPLATKENLFEETLYTQYPDYYPTRPSYYRETVSTGLFLTTMVVGLLCPLIYLLVWLGSFERSFGRFGKVQAQISALFGCVYAAATLTAIGLICGLAIR